MSVDESLRARSEHGGTDQGWAWVVLVACFFSNFLTSGFSMSLGSYYVALHDHFQQSNMVTSWIGALNFTFVCAAGPVASFLITRFGCRLPAILGGSISGLSILATSFADSIYVVFVTLGVLCGFGLGLSDASMLVALSRYFVRYRSTVIGFAVTGTSVATFVFPLLTEYLIPSTGWQGALMITSSLVFHIILFGMTLRPKNQVTVSQDSGNRLSNSSISSVGEQKHVCRNWKYWLVCIGVGIFSFSLLLLLTHITPYGRYKGLSPYSASLLLSGIGISGIPGNIFLGVVVNHPRVNASIVYSVCCLSAGLSISLFTLATHFASLMTLSCVLGVGFAAYCSVLVEVLIDTVGLENFATAYGYLLIACAVGALAGPPAAGWIYDVSNDYSASLHLGAAGLYLAALILPIPRSLDWCKSKSERQANGQRRKKGRFNAQTSI